MQPEEPPPTPSAATTRHHPHVYITEGVPCYDTVLYCPSCWAYLQSPGSWIRREPRSWTSATTPGSAREVADIHLGRLRRHIARLGLTIAAVELLSTEPRPKRFELRIHLRHEALKVEQSYVAELTTRDRLCDACGRAQADPDPDHWPAVVTVRQRASSTLRTLCHLRSLLVCYCGNDSFLRVDWDADAGALDVHVVSRPHADRFVRFVSTVAPARAVGAARQLVSRDADGGPYSLHAISVEISPVCTDDLVLLPVEASLALGRLGPLVLCIKVTSSLALLDTNNMRVVVAGAEECERFGLEPLLSRGRLVEYVVLGVQHDPSGHVTVLGASYMMSWAQVARASDVGRNGTVFTVKTHLGYELEVGCHALGYDLCGDSAYGHGLEKHGQSHSWPAAVLATRYYDGEDSEDSEESAGEMEDGSDIEEVAMGIGCLDLNPTDDKDLTTI